jgi:hypothetical protein
MILFHPWKKALQKVEPESQKPVVLDITEQIRSWRKANRRMRWGIKEDEFDQIRGPLPLTEEERKQGYIGIGLFYGFGDDGYGNSNPVLSGKVVWEFTCKGLWKKTWRCEYIDFNKTDHIRLRPEAPCRPKGFYYAKFTTGEKYQHLTVSQRRKKFGDETGCGPEGLQLLTITHKHFQKLMNDRKMLFMAFADYDIAPYGFNDFFDSMQMFCSNGVLGLGIGNVDQNYPRFGIPALRFLPQQDV